MQVAERFSSCCICKVDGLAVVLLLVEGDLQADLVDLGLSDLRLKIDLIFAQLSSSQCVVGNELLLHRSVLHDGFAVVTILGDLFLQGRNFNFLLALKLLLVGSLPQLRQLVLHLEHLFSVGLEEVFLVLFEHVIQFLVKVRDLVIDLAGEENDFIVAFELLECLHEIGAGLALRVSGHLRLGVLCEDTVAERRFTLSLQRQLQILDLLLWVNLRLRRTLLLHGVFMLVA